MVRIQIFLVLVCMLDMCVGQQWSPAGATWYGPPNGAGTDGGSCGYGAIVSQAPISSMIAAAGPSLYQSGKECGACYQVKCTDNPACSGKAVTITIIDSCPGGPCASDPAHFDLSGTAFGALANPGQEEKLRNIGVLQVTYARTPCNYAGTNIAFHIDAGSNANYIAFVVEFENGDGDLKSVALQGSGQTSWVDMQLSWGATWKLDGAHLQAPISVKLTSGLSGKTLIAQNVIPSGFQPGSTYRSLVNF